MTHYQKNEWGRVVCSLMFIFDGGVLSESEVAAIQLQEDELSHFTFFALESLPETMTKTLKSRVLAAFQQRSKHNRHNGIYLENQRMV